jgi:superfamily I DNA/RNA helicase
VVAADAEEQVVSAAAGSGKCLGLGTPVMLFDGRVIAVENVKVGDRLMGPDSKPRVVQSVTQGKGMLYQITPVKGDPWVCNDVHVLTLAGTNRRNGQIRDIPLNEFQKLGKNERQKDWKLFRVGVEYKARPTPIDPYFLGLWIGDGTTTASVITNMEPEIREFCAEYAERLGMFCEQTYVPRVNAWTIAFTAKKGRKSPAAPNHLRQYLRLCCCARNNAKRKIIPEKFMVNSREVRLQLLAGIIDTDGYYHRGCYEIASKWSQLAWQIKQLAASLGFGVNYSCKVVNGTTYYRVNICGEGLEKIPVRVPRKKAEKRRQIKRATVTGFSVDPIGVGDYYGFTLDGDGRFLLGDFTVTHNTSTTVRKIEYLVNQLGVEPSSIKVMAFNKHAAREVKSRLAQNIGLEKANQVYPQTTHGFCLSEMKAWSPFHREGCGARVTGSSMPWDGKYLTPGPMLVRQAWEEALKRLGHMTKKGDGGWKRSRKDDIGVDIGTLKRWIGKSKNEGMTLTDFMASEWERREDPRVQILMAGLLLYEEQKGMLAREKDRGDSRTEEYVEYFLPPAGSADAESGDWDTKLRKALGRLEGSEGVSVRFDFDDMLNEFYLGITELPTDNDRAKAAKRERIAKLRDDFKYWMVDEAQDLAPVQHKIFNAVARGRDGDGQYILIGDPDQSIYGFRGATPESFVEAEKTSESMSIPINYRSRKEIVELADKLVDKNNVRIKRSNVANRPAGGTVKAYSLKDYESISDYVTADIVAKLGNGGYLNERGTPRFSIICRTNKELDMFEDELAIRGITYVRRGGRPFWLKDDVGATTALIALAYHISGKMKLSPDDQLDFIGRAFKFPNRPGSPGGKSNVFYLEPIASSHDPIGTLLSVSPKDVTGRPGGGEAVAAFVKDLRAVTAAVKDGPTGMFRAMLGMESKGYDGQTFGDLMLEASIRSADDSELQDTAAEAGGDDPVEGVSAFSKLFRFYEYNKFASPDQFVKACVDATTLAKVMENKIIAKKDDANLEAVNLSTIHMTKGLEYENVYTVMNQGKFPSNVFPTDDLLANRDRLAKYEGLDNEEKLKNMKLEEERRLAYVAITRATESFIAFASETDLKGQPAMPSQFLSEMGLTPEKIEIDESVKVAVDSHMGDILRSL